MSVDRLRIGVIGAGWFVSRRHLPELQKIESVEVSALCRRSEDLLRLMAEHFQVPRSYTDYRDLLAKEELDAVLIATPHSLHYEHAKACLERGLHVMLEKPMTLRSHEAAELDQLASDRGLVLLVAHNPPYSPYAHCIKHAIAEGRIGDLESISIQWLGSIGHVFGRVPLPESLPGVVKPTLFRGDPELSGGGHFFDGGAHMVAEIIWTTGQAVTRVSAVMDTLPLDMRNAVALALADGVLCTISATADSQTIAKRIRHSYCGSAGTITLEGLPFRVSIASGGETQVTEEDDMPETVEPVQDFVDAIRAQRPVASDGSLGVKVVRVLEAAYESARTGRAVALS